MGAYSGRGWSEAEGSVVGSAADENETTIQDQSKQMKAVHLLLPAGF